MIKKKCVRCGTCCRKGGPGLHLEDKGLIDEGVLDPGDLVCFRKGEFVFDQARESLVPLEEELIKIRGKQGSWECLFYDPAIRGCQIYRNRPVECRILTCWDTGPIEELMNRDDRLTRSHLVPEKSGLAELIREHEARCGLHLVDAVVRTNDMDTPSVRREILDICSYDLSFRETLVQKTRTGMTELECYFGRPLYRAVLGYDPWLGSEDFLGCFLCREPFRAPTG